MPRWFYASRHFSGSERSRTPLYLWHWPLLIIPMEFAGHPLSLKDNMGWVAVALVFS